MTDIIFDPIEIKASDQLRSYGDISKMQNGQKKKRPLEKTGFIFEQYKNTPNKEYFTDDKKIRDYLTFTIFTEQPECLKAEQLFDLYDNKLNQNLQHVIGEDFQQCKVKPTCAFPVKKAGQKPQTGDKKKEFVQRKRVNLNIPTVNALYYNDIRLDEKNTKIYYELSKPIRDTEPKEAIRNAKIAKLEHEFMIKQVETDTVVPVLIKFSEIEIKREFRDLTVYHHLIDSIAEGTKKPNECKTKEEFEQIYGPRIEKNVKNMDELEDLMGFNGYRRYFIVPSKTSREIKQADADVKMKVNIKWEIDSIEIIQVKGGGSFKEYKAQERSSALDDYGDIGTDAKVNATQTVLTNLSVKPTKNKSEFDDEPPKTTQTAKPVATPTAKPVTQPVTQLPESDEEDGSEYETDDEAN